MSFRPMFAAVLFLLCSAAAIAQNKPGLWESSSTIAWQKVPIPPDMAEQMKQMPNNPFASTTTTVKSCITPEQVATGLPPADTPRQCEVKNYRKTADGTSADVVCRGQMTGNGAFSTHRVDDNTYKVHMHFAGATSQGAEAEFTSDGSTKFLGKECGDIAPGKWKVM